MVIFIFLSFFLPGWDGLMPCHVAMPKAEPPTVGSVAAAVHDNAPASSKLNDCIQLGIDQGSKQTAIHGLESMVEKIEEMQKNDA